LLANFENRLLGRTVSVDWIGVALALVGIGIALLPLADQFNFLKPYAVPGGVALILAGLLLCLVPVWKRIQARREAKPRSCAAPAAKRDESLVEPTRSQKITVSWRRAASATAKLAGAAGDPAVAARPSPLGRSVIGFNKQPAMADCADPKLIEIVGS
jgi:hypothetical protein